MKTLHFAIRVRDLERSVDFYTRFGFSEIGRVPLDGGTTLVLLNLPGDGEAATIELVHDPKLTPLEIGGGFSHFGVQVDDLAATFAGLAAKGISYEAPQLPGGEQGPKTSFVIDPDGYRIELVEWPAGHENGITRADFNSAG